MGLFIIVTFDMVFFKKKKRKKTKKKELKTAGIFNNSTYLHSRRLDGRKPAYIDHNATLEILTEKIKGHQSDLKILIE